MSLIQTPSIIIPKYSMTGPYKGRMSTKSSPAVDSSAPRSLSRSIKYRDQQNKERLLRAVEKFKKELQQICSTSHHHSLRNFPEQDKVYYGHKKPQVDTEKLFDVYESRSQTSSPVLTAREVMGLIDKELRDASPRTSVYQSSHKKKPYNDPQKQTYSGDLLDKHPASFTSTKTPFKPRLLKKPSKSFLSKYRYYMAPTYKSSPRTSSRQDKAKVSRSLEDLNGPVEMINRTPPSKTEKWWNMAERTKEEDLKYLRFLEDLTNDIILRGCRSNSAMERVIQDHLLRKHPHLDEVKKMILVQELRDELERNVKLDFSISYEGTQYGSRYRPLPRNLHRLLEAQ
ncbi:spermatogenesis-associated protein 7 homolog isoform X2 [Hyla sarda]|uniref:spermatogenesis-associated protein 7 homolog isoform X2 n=1 Tax=Hyla sarda TaxID=327740 RepID=UPI0024C2AB00|nr:spermatogenesis-associated protein 7 homolog isoform X2 [Hyla sarda]